MELKEQFPPICPFATLDTWKAFFLFERTWRNITNVPCVITSINDNVHRVGSKHYQGLAGDFSSHNLHNETKEQVINVANAELNKMGYRCFIEDLNKPNEHIHVERI